MDTGKSRLPMMIKKPTVARAHIPTDRMVAPSNTLNKVTTTNNVRSNLINRSALTSFESVVNSLKNNMPSNRPTKRHASPEFRAPKPPLLAAKKLRRSRSISEIESVLSRAQTQNRTADNRFTFQSATTSSAVKTAPWMVSKQGTNLKSGIKPSLAVPMKAKTTVQKPSTAQKLKTIQQSGPAHKRLVLNANSAAAKKDENDKPKPAVTSKKIPPYDFKARFNDLLEKHKVLKEKHEHLKEQLGEFESLPEQYDECRAKLSNLEDEYKTVQTELADLKQQSSADQLKIQTLNAELSEKIEECRIVTEAKNHITEKYTAAELQNGDLKTCISELEIQLKQYKETIEKQDKELQDAADQLYQSNLNRKDLHNTIMDLRGNIRVFCRVRPPLEAEENRTQCMWQYIDETSLEISSVEVNKKPVKHDFTFDQVFAPNSQQEDIFELVSPLVQSALDGYNVCIFAYGQTGSGKTFTMDGTEAAPGIIPRTIDVLFECFRQNKRLGWEFKLHASALEIYNEVLFDLLSNDAKDLEIRLASAKTRTEVFVSNLTDVLVDNKDDLHKLMQLAKRNRATAATVGNERSSRSHSVTQLCLRGTHSVKDEISMSTINLIDLAGSESPKTSVRMEETKKINKSLSELTNVIMALLQKQDHIPYRNSKLTHLLMPCLGGNSKTLMFVNVSPFQDCYVETVKSLRFAASVNNCKMNKAKKNKMFTQ